MPDDDIKVHERLARIETKLDALAEIEGKVDRLEQEMARYRGMYGGMLLVITALVAAFKLFGGVVTGYFSG